MDFKGMKSIEKFKHMLSDISDERGTEEGIWLYLKDGWETQDYLQTIHENTVRECIDKLKKCKKIEIEEEEEKIKGKIVSYLRVSTNDQTVSNQRQELERRGYKIDKEFIDEGVSGTVRDREGLNKMLDYVREGDTIITYELSRIGRSTKDIMGIIHQLKESKVNLILVREGIDLSTKMGEMMLTMLSSIYQMEVETLKERQAIGIIRAKAEGKYKGRKKIEFPSNWEEVYKQWKKREITGKKAMETLELKRNTFYKLIKDWEEKKK